jgi:Protein of unknown function (DUF2637)
VTAQPSGTGRGARDWLDAGIDWASGATAVGMFTYGFALSYSVLYSVAVAVGLAPWAARVWPLGFESFMASAALNALAEQRHRRHLPEWHQRVPWYPWTLTGLTAGASLLLNWFHPAIPLDPPPGWLRSVVYGLPPLAAVFAWHLFLQRIAHRRHPATAKPEDGPVPVPVVGEDATTGTVPTAEPAATASPAPGGGAGAERSRPRRAGRPRPTGTRAGEVASAELVERARSVAAAFEAEHGRTISRDALRRALHVSNRVASELLPSVRALALSPPSVPVPLADGTPARTATSAAGPVTAGAGPVPASDPAADNGHRPTPEDQPAPVPPSPSRSPARVP